MPGVPGPVQPDALGPRRSRRGRGHRRGEARGVPTDQDGTRHQAPPVHHARAARGRSGAARHPRVRAHTAEALGTFALVFAGCGAIAVDARTGELGHIGVALAFGLVVAVMIYALGHISGAHLNPAVSVAFAMGGHVSWTRAATYSVAQVAGAVVAAVALAITLGQDADLGVTRPSIP